MRHRKLARPAWGKIAKLDHQSRCSMLAGLGEQAQEVASVLVDELEWWADKDRGSERTDALIRIVMAFNHTVDRRTRIAVELRNEDKHVGNEATDLIERLADKNEELKRLIHGSRAAQLAPPKSGSPSGDLPH